MGFKLNLTPEEIKSAQGGFTPIAEGVYSAVIFGAEEKVSKAGNDMYQIEYLITDGPEVRKNFKIRGYYTVTGKALFAVIGLLKAVGFPYPKSGDPAGEISFPDAEEFLNQQVNLKIVVEPYASVDDNGADITAYRNQIKAVYPYDEDKITSADSENTLDSSPLGGGLSLP